MLFAPINRAFFQVKCSCLPRYEVHSLPYTQWPFVWLIIVAFRSPYRSLRAIITASCVCGLSVLLTYLHLSGTAGY